MKNKQHQKWVSLLMTLCLLLQLTGGTFQYNAFAASDVTWAIGDYFDNEDLIFYNVEPSEIVLWGYHNKKTNQNYYKTDGFVLSTYSYNTGGACPYRADENRIRVRKLAERTAGGNTIITPYVIDFEDIVGAAGKLGITGDSIGNGTVPIYLNVVYDIYKGDNLVVDDVIGAQEMINAPVKYRLGYTSWDPATVRKIPSYYNLRIDLSAACTYDVKIVPVDENYNEIKGAVNKNGTSLTFAGYPKKVIYNNPIQYTLPAGNKDIKKGSIDYTYQNVWFYKYHDRKLNKWITTNQYPGSELNTTAPDAKPGSELTIYVVYKPVKGKPYKVKVVAEKKDGTHLKDLQSERDTYGGDSFNYDMKEKDKLLSSKYIYQNQYKLTYTDPNGVQKTDPFIYEEDIEDYPMPAAKKDSTAVFHMIYDTKPTPSTSPTPKPTATPTPVPNVFDPPIVTAPLPETHDMEFTIPVNTGVIRADNRGAEKFTAVQGVPTTESLYGQVTAKDYLVGYKFVKKTGVKYYPIQVKKNYNLTWMKDTPTTAPSSAPEQVNDTITVTQTITVARAYAYWEIQNFECYKIGSAVLRNYALPDEAITIYPNYSYYHPPTISINHSGDESYHVIPPAEYTNGITLPPENISSSGTSMPSIPKEDFTRKAWEMTGNISVKNDYLSFNGTTVMSDTVTQMLPPDINRNGVPQCETFINENVLYKPNNIIEATKVNGTFASSGTITYTAIATVNPTRPANPQYSIDGINKVVIHTPVVCIPSITDDNDKHSQLINPTEGCNQLVLDPNPTLSDFVVSISNTGSHSDKQGYYSRDFSRSLRDPNVSYIAEDKGVLMNQVKFPFDVYMDVGANYDQRDDKFIKAHTWLTIGRAAPRFYLPMTVNEGVYTVQFRTVAVNGLPYINKAEEYANKNLINYVATNTLDVEVSGRIYGLTIYDLTDYPIWEEVFRVKDSMDFKKDFSKYLPGTGSLTYSKNRSYTYTLGTNDQYGVDTGRNAKYTFPLVNGSHPYYKNMGILKTGYMVRFLLDTTGNMFSDKCKILIKPKFYHVDKDGKNRVAVDLYYTEEINGKTKHLVKVGSPLDQTNLKTVRTGDIFLGIPETELRQTAKLRGMTYGKFTAKSSSMFNFSEIRLNWAFRTYINNAYTSRVKGYDSFEAMKDTGIKESDLLERMQRWYGQYYIPNEVHVVEKDFDVMDYADKYGVDYSESFWKKNGYIIVNFSIETIGEDGSRRLSYINAANYRDKGNCSMWIQEGPVLTKKSSDGANFQFYAGDFAIFYVGKNASSDYTPGAIY